MTTFNFCKIGYFKNFFPWSDNFKVVINNILSRTFKTVRKAQNKTQHSKLVIIIRSFFQCRKLATYLAVYSTVCFHFTRSSASPIRWSSCAYVCFLLHSIYPSHWVAHPRILFFNFLMFLSRSPSYRRIMCARSLIAYEGSPRSSGTDTLGSSWY